MADDTSGQSFFSTPPQRPSPRPAILRPPAPRPAAPPAARAPATPRAVAPVLEVADAGIFSRFMARSFDSI